MKMRLGVAFIPALVAIAACSPVSKEEKAELTKPVDCRTAEGDLRVLQSEKDSTAKQIAEGVAAVVPAGFIVGVVRGNENDKFKVASGEYNKTIDKKIAEIKKTCNLS